MTSIQLKAAFLLTASFVVETVTGIEFGKIQTKPDLSTNFKMTGIAEMHPWLIPLPPTTAMDVVFDQDVQIDQVRQQRRVNGNMQDVIVLLLILIECKILRVIFFSLAVVEKKGGLS